MGILDRYHLRPRKPAPANFNAVHENFREVERWGNVLPIPSPEMFALAGSATVSTTLHLYESFTFNLARPSTVIEVDLFIDARVASAGGGAVRFWAYIDGVAIDTGNFAAMNEAAVRVVTSTGYVATIGQAGPHTLELWGQKSINAGVFNYGGNMRLSVF